MKDEIAISKTLIINPSFLTVFSLTNLTWDSKDNTYFFRRMIRLHFLITDPYLHINSLQFKKKLEKSMFDQLQEYFSKTNYSLMDNMVLGKGIRLN